MSDLTAPVRLTPGHDVSHFSSGEPALDDWLRERALVNAELDASRTYVVCARGEARVVAYYALSMGQIFAADVVGSMRRNMPRTIPAVLLRRLAIDRAWQGQGLGRALLKDAVERSLKASQDISARLVIVHAISPSAEEFYLRFGFTRLPVQTPTLALDLMKYRRASANQG